MSKVLLIVVCSLFQGCYVVSTCYTDLSRSYVGIVSNPSIPSISKSENSLIVLPPSIETTIRHNFNNNVPDTIFQSVNLSEREIFNMMFDSCYSGATEYLIVKPEVDPHVYNVAYQYKRLSKKFLGGSLRGINEFLDSLNLLTSDSRNNLTDIVNDTTIDYLIFPYITHIYRTKRYINKIKWIMYPPFIIGAAGMRNSSQNFPVIRDRLFRTHFFVLKKNTSEIVAVIFMGGQVPNYIENFLMPALLNLDSKKMYHPPLY